MPEPQKIIVKIHDGVGPMTALEAVGAVIREGRISDGGKSFCSATVFSTQGIAVYASTTQTGTDRFQVCKTSR